MKTIIRELTKQKEAMKDLYGLIAESLQDIPEPSSPVKQGEESASEELWFTFARLENISWTLLLNLDRMSNANLPKKTDLLRELKRHINSCNTMLDHVAKGEDLPVTLINGANSNTLFRKIGRQVTNVKEHLSAAYDYAKTTPASELYANAKKENKIMGRESTLESRIVKLEKLVKRTLKNEEFESSDDLVDLLFGEALSRFEALDEDDQERVLDKVMSDFDYDMMGILEFPPEEDDDPEDRKAYRRAKRELNSFVIDVIRFEL